MTRTLEASMSALNAAHLLAASRGDHTLAEITAVGDRLKGAADAALEAYRRAEDAEHDAKLRTGLDDAYADTQGVARALVEAGGAALKAGELFETLGNALAAADELLDRLATTTTTEL